MRHYNVYYHSTKVNKRPLSESVIEKMKEKEFIFKHDEETNKTQKFPVNELKIVKCIIV